MSVISRQAIYFLLRGAVWTRNCVASRSVASVIFLLADFAGPLAPQLLFDVFDETENNGKEVS